MVLSGISRAFSLFIIIPVKTYQYLISPLLGKNCRFEPSCSNYMLEAVSIWGPVKGLWLGLRRISRCHPWGGSGVDPVPQKQTKKNPR
ncbi:MAG: membrane protein insertion efficiency factor YidD [Saprospiraceae bacterium]|nr:membrane protein insertion efficiency factor YidD [Saprospiraceae bacterium]MBP9210659.1 membrane protein insertion efficiency factor YidD [Saprospiraceae bacterium]